MSSFKSVYLSVCLSRYGMPKNKDSERDNNNYYYDDDDEVSWAAMEVYDDETSCVLFYVRPNQWNRPYIL